MSLVCAQCSRVNPLEAAYCYHDGAALAGRSGGPINAGAAPFPNQFVFPDGLACRNFDQLAIACQHNWSSAVNLLKQGYLGSFFGGMGRVDLAMAAQEAAKFPDIDRGLDQLLAKLPTRALQGPKLQAEPSEISLGQIKVNEDRTSELHLTNLGMRLLYGTVTSDCKWLALGDAPGHPEKMFQFGSDSVVPVQVRGQHLRAGTKPLEGHLVIDSNGGTMSVTFKADVPITPYAEGLFAGAVTPRQIAEKAKANPKDAASYFERGDIANWYAGNGWNYPVQGPIMSGMGSIQQFFEALGVAKAPKVEFEPKTLDLSGAVGKTLETSIEVTTADRKVVYGWASCDQPWVEVGKTKLSGKSATIPITIQIPSQCPPTLEATLNVVGNGNQKAAVPLRVKVAGGKAGVVLQQEEEIVPVEIIEEEIPMTVEILDMPASASAPIVKPTPIPAFSPVPALVAIVEAPIPAAVTAKTPMVANELAEEELPFALPNAAAPTKSKSNGPAVPTPTVAIPRPPAGQSPPVRLLLHLVPVGVLFVCLLVLLVFDIIRAGKAPGGDADEVDPRAFVEIQFDEGRPSEDYSDSMKFAVHKVDPDNKSAEKVKLNWYVNGLGNSTVAKIDGNDFAFGFAPDHGKWALGSEKGKDVSPATWSPPKNMDKYGGKTRTFEFSNGIFITQTVTVEPGDPVQIASGEYKRLLTNCLVRYKIHNRDPKRTHSVGLRVLMDTCIGNNDGVPFTFPGVSEVVSTKRDFQGPDVPDFVQVLERPSLRDPGIILQLNLRFSDKLEPPSRFQLTRYPTNNQNPDKRTLNKWEVPLVDMRLPGELEGDSSVVIYWDPKDLGPNKKRELAFTYGLGNVSVSTGGKIGLTVGGATYVNGELTVLALISDRDAKFATLDLPPGLKLLDGTLKQKITHMRSELNKQPRPSPVTWRVRADREGKHSITVSTDTGALQSRRVTITAKSLFN